MLRQHKYIPIGIILPAFICFYFVKAVTALIKYVEVAKTLQFYKIAGDLTAD
jgi:hypothetical protein